MYSVILLGRLTMCCIVRLTVTGLITVAVAFWPSSQASIRASSTWQMLTPLSMHPSLNLLQSSGSALNDATKLRLEYDFGRLFMADVMWLAGV